MSTICYFGVHSASNPVDRFNDSINTKLNEAHQNTSLTIDKYHVSTNTGISKINKDLKLSDALTYPTEVRIYSSQGITNYSSLFRMYKIDKNKWKAEFYEHFDAVVGQSKLKTKRKNLISKNDIKFVFKNLLYSYILELPSLDEIFWKLEKRKQKRIEIKAGNGKSKVTYQNIKEQTSILDGHGYIVQIRSAAWKKQHAFKYSNPERYLEIYPEIDELIYMNEILNIIKTEFGIWAD